MARPPGVDAVAWRALLAASAAQPTQPRGPWATHSRLKAALDEVANGNALVLAHDRLVMPWREQGGVWRNLPRAPGQPDCVKRFCCVPSLAAWLQHELLLPRECRVHYEVLRERTPCRYFLDFDLPLSEAQLAEFGADCVDRLAQVLERHVLAALLELTDASPQELAVLSVDGNGASCCRRISLHVIAHGALLPDNEHAAASVRLAVIERIRSAARAGTDAGAAALVRCCPHLESAIDRINTKNRLRRCTGHTKLGQQRWSAPLPRHAGLPPAAFFVSGAAAVGERVLSMRRPLMLRAPPSLQRSTATAAAAAVSSDVAPAAEAAIRAELSAIAQLRGGNAAAARVLPPRGNFPCYTVFTSCRSCPWRAQDTPTAGRAPGAAHRSSRLYVAFHADRVELGCTAPRHTQRARFAYSQPGSAAALFPDAAACIPPADALAGMEISPVRAAAEVGQENVVSPFVQEHLDDIFSPRFCVDAAPSA
jgi:hypothetical protein